MNRSINTVIVAFLGAACLCLGYSCTKVDNYAGPNSSFQGNLIDSVTGKNMLTETGGYQMQLKELSWSDNPTPYYIPSKPDGTFEDTRIFGGHYSVLPTQGAFWPVDSVVMDIKGNTTKTFTVVPYLEITNFTHVAAGDSLVMQFQISAPRTAGLPTIIDAWPFVNNTPFVGSTAYIQPYTISAGGNPNKNTVDINSSWNAGIGATTYEIRVRGLLPGRTYYARVGVRLNDSYKKFDYSDVITVPVATK